MKLLMLCALLLFLGLHCLGQAPKKTKLIIVKGVTLKEAVGQALAEGYMIDRIDTAFGVVSTKSKPIPRSLATIVVQLLYKDSSIYISGVANPNVKVRGGGVTFDGRSAPIENAGMKGSDMRLCFTEMDRLAKSFGRPVEYK